MISRDVGTPILWNTFRREDDLRTTLAERVGVLVRSEGIVPAEIAILVPDEGTMGQLQVNGSIRIGRYPVTNAEDRKPDAIVVDTIRRFKGLESPVVLLAVNSYMKDWCELLYTAMTRPQCVLEIFGPPEMLRQMQSSTE
jgi:superfamily I DNA and RNA helicase